MSNSKLPAKAGANLPAKRTPSTMLDRIRAAKPAKQIAVVDRSTKLAAAMQQRRPRLVFSFDATASREPSWNTAKQMTDALFTVLPGELDVALAVHSGGVVSQFSDFSNDVSQFRDRAAGVRCTAGHTALVPLMEQTREHAGVKVFLHIGDCFEESAGDAYAAADAFKARGIRAVMFHDASTGRPDARAVFEEIARRTGGVCVDFHSGDKQAMQDIFQAVAVLATGGIKLLEQKQEQLPGAKKLLLELK